MSKQYPLNVPAPHHFTYAVRDLPEVTVEQRERALQATHYNEFAFPSGMLTVDMLSDSGTTAMTNHQWASLFLGDEAYGRNTGYYVLLDTFRDIFERGGEKNWKKIIDLVRTDCRDVEKMMDEVYLCEYEGGLFNGGAAQMERPNAFIIQQGRAAESVLMEIVRNILAKRHPGKKFTIRYDKKSKKYWTLSNFILEKDRHNIDGGAIRNTQVLMCSDNLTEWCIKDTVLTCDQPELYGFQYVDWQFDGKDIVFVSRTAWRDKTGNPPRQHDANYMTFHRIRNFRAFSKK